MLLLNGMVTVIAGFAGHGRSSYLLSELYKKIVCGQSVVLFTEMPARQVMNKLITIHSGHPKFEDKRRELGIIDCLDYKSMYTWQLHSYEAKFYEIVRADFPSDAVHVIVADNPADIETLAKAYDGPSIIAIDCGANYDCEKARKLAEETETAVVMTHQMSMDVYKKALDSRCGYSTSDFSDSLKYHAVQLITVWHEDHPFLPSYKVETLFTKGV